MKKYILFVVMAFASIGCMTREEVAERKARFVAQEQARKKRHDSYVSAEECVGKTIKNVEYTKNDHKNDVVLITFEDGTMISFTAGGSHINDLETNTY